MKNKFVLLALLVCSVCYFACTPGEARSAESTQKSSANMIISEDLYEILSKAAREESRKLGIDISFAITDESGALLYFKRMGDSIPISVKLVPNKAYTAAKLRTATENLTAEVAQGGSLFAINTVDPQLVAISGGFPLFHDGRCVGAIGIGGGTSQQDSQIGNQVVKVFEQSVKR